MLTKNFCSNPVFSNSQKQAYESSCDLIWRNRFATAIRSQSGILAHS